MKERGRRGMKRQGMKEKKDGRGWKGEEEGRMKRGRNEEGEGRREGLVK